MLSWDLATNPQMPWLHGHMLLLALPEPQPVLWGPASSPSPGERNPGHSGEWGQRAIQAF